MGRTRKYKSIAEANRVGGLARAKALTPERRVQIAVEAAAARVRPGRKKLAPEDAGSTTHGAGNEAQV